MTSSNHSESIGSEIERVDQAPESVSAEDAQDAARTTANLSVEPETVALNEADLSDAAEVCVEPPQPKAVESEPIEVAPVAVRQAVQLPEKEHTKPLLKETSPAVIEKSETPVPEKPSLKEDRPDTREEKPKSSCKIVLTKHDVAAAPEVAKNLKDCDIAAFESIGGSPEERQEEEKRRTTFISPEWEEIKDTPEGQEITRTFEDRENHSSFAVLKELQGSGKEVKLIDVDAEHQAMVLEEEEERLARQFYEQEVCYCDDAVLGRTLTRRIEVMATGAAMREEAMVDQLQQIGNDNPGKKTGAVMGVTHMPVVDMFDDETELERVFTHSRIGASGFEVFGALTQFQEAILQKRTLGEVSRELFKRVLLSQHLLIYAEEHNETMAVREERLDQVVRELSYSEVTSLLYAIEDAKASQNIESLEHDEAENKIIALLQPYTEGEVGSDPTGKKEDTSPVMAEEENIVTELTAPLAPEASEGGDSGRPPEGPRIPLAEGGDNDPERPNQAGYKFVLVTHTPEAGREIAEQLRDCPIIVFEGTFPTDAQRQGQEHIRTNLISKHWAEAAADDPEGEWAQEFTAMLEGSPKDYTIATLKELTGTDKRVFMIDMDESHPKYHLVHEEKALLKDFYNAFYNHAPNSELRELLLKHAQAKAMAHEAREKYMAERLKLIRLRYPGVKIGVVTGAAHSPLSHQFVGMAEGIERTAVVPDYPFSKGRGQRIRYPHVVQLARHVRMLPGKEVSDGLLNVRFLNLHS